MWVKGIGISRETRICIWLIGKKIKRWMKWKLRETERSTVHHWWCTHSSGRCHRASQGMTDTEEKCTIIYHFLSFFLLYFSIFSFNLYYFIFILVLVFFLLFYNNLDEVFGGVFIHFEQYTLLFTTVGSLLLINTFLLLS